MFVTDEMIAEMVERYGRPEKRRFCVLSSKSEVDDIRSTQKHGRNHDVTLYIIKGEKVIVIAKPFYPKGQFRAPSGGLSPGESFHAGIAREAMEETGVELELSKFILQTSVRFLQKADDETVGPVAWEHYPEEDSSRDLVCWRSFVFVADYVSGDFEFTDKREIREVKLADWSEFEVYSKMMRDSDIGGLHYRAALHDAVVECLG